MTISTPPVPATRLDEPVPTRRPYAELPHLAGKAFLPIAFAARLPFSMLTIGTLTLVTQATGSVALGGLASAASALGTALGGPTQGALADRAGQRPVLFTCVPVTVAAILGLLAAAATGAPTVVLLLVAAVMGAAVPQVGPLSRVRWLRLAEGRPRVLTAAMSYESTADEVSFVLGPALVGILASIGSVQIALLAAAACVAVFGTAFAAHPTASLVSATVVPTRGSGGLLRVLIVPTVGMIAMGMLFGGMQASVTAFAQDVGSAGSAGLVYAVMGVGSAITALSVVALPARWSLASRWFWFAAGLVASMLGLLALVSTGSLGAFVVGLVLAGLFIGPTMVTIFSVAGEIAPEGRTAATMTVVASANVVGVAIGAAIGGRLAQDVSTFAAFAAPVAAAVLLVLVGGVALRTARKQAGTEVDPVRLAGS